VDPRSGSGGPLFSGHKWTYGQVSGIGGKSRRFRLGRDLSGAILRIRSEDRPREADRKLPALIEAAVEDAAGAYSFRRLGGLYARSWGRERSAAAELPP